MISDTGQLHFYIRYISLLDVPDLKKSTLCQADNTRSEPLLFEEQTCESRLNL